MNKTISKVQMIGLSAMLLARSASAENFAMQIGDTVPDGAPGVGAGRIIVNTENDYR